MGELEKVNEKVEELKKAAYDKGSSVSELTKTKITELSKQISDVIQLEKRKEATTKTINLAYQAIGDKLVIISDELEKAKSILANKALEIRQALYASAKVRYEGIKDYSETTLLPAVRGRTASTAVTLDTKFGLVDIIG